MKAVGVFVFLSFLFVGQGFTQEANSPVYTDRPGVTFNGSTTQAKTILIQAGYGYFVFDEEFANDPIQSGDAQFRYGVSDNLEFSIGGFYENAQLNRGEIESTESNVYQVNLNSRYTFYRGEGVLQAFGVQAGVVFESIDDLERPDNMFVMGMSASFSISDRISGASMIQSTFPDGVFTINCGYSATNRLGIFLEYAQFPTQEDFFQQVLINTGGSYTIDSAFILDFAGNFDITPLVQGSDWTTSIGFQLGFSKRIEF